MASTPSSNVCPVSLFVLYESLRYRMAPWASQRADLLSMTAQALLVLGMYRQLVDSVGLRSVLCFNIGCAASAVLYSIASCEYLQLTPLPFVHGCSSADKYACFSLASSILVDRSCPSVRRF